MTHSSKTSIEVNGNLAGKKYGDGPKSKQRWKHSGLLRQLDSLCRLKFAVQSLILLRDYQSTSHGPWAGVSTSLSRL